MAAPILLNSRVVKREGKKFFLAISNFGFNDSGFMVECEHDASFDHPWAVKMIQLKLGKGITYFNMMRDHFYANRTPEEQEKSKDEVFAYRLSNNISSHLNAFYGATQQGTPISLPVEEFEKMFSEQVFTMVTPAEVDMEFEFMPLNIDMKELFEKAYGSHKFNEGLPEHILNPPTAE